VSSPGSVTRDARLRLFLGLRLPDDVLDVISAWQTLCLRGDLRVVGRENLHVTLAFLGSRPAAELAAILGALRDSAHAGKPFELAVDGYRETRSVAMLTLADPSGEATRLAERVHARLEKLGVYERERRPWLPHLTVARFRERPRLRPAITSSVLAPFAPSGAAAFLSHLHPSGARYEVLESFRLGG
jgi:RNA 2',3'-cyclic 3'-phosphodiesterase